MMQNIQDLVLRLHSLKTVSTRQCWNKGVIFIWLMRIAIRRLWLTWPREGTCTSYYLYLYVSDIGPLINRLGASCYFRILQRFGQNTEQGLRRCTLQYPSPQVHVSSVRPARSA